jgi:hypothetical protein
MSTASNIIWNAKGSRYIKRERVDRLYSVLPWGIQLDQDVATPIKPEDKLIAHDYLHSTALMAVHLRITSPPLLLPRRRYLPRLDRRVYIEY